jgi:hypothetical protein
MEHDFSWQISEKSSNGKFHDYPTVGSRAVPCIEADRWMDKQVEVTSRFLQFHEHV